ncbi:cell division protein FtsL [Bacillus salipaludis]|uniref:Cell division protein FtsL n=1 Tax=Bacillus salipaludis TaxID=2547811 RepID=A0A4R5VZ76_9BACI|nr:cell division protein FtsL [Bacillus salipaludis]MDQ6596863.1 cell division protein FtsL [Bacillus salipaludis]TDK64926.1 cell division protein FtsL [Bacillus salipaludis]
MSNLARKYQEQQQVTETVQEKLIQKVKAKKSWLTPGEKVLGIAFAGMVCFGAVHMISNQSQIWQVNKSIQETETSIEKQKKVNNDLKVQVSELSTYERIYEKAKEMGLVLNENNVKVVQK